MYFCRLKRQLKRKKKLTLHVLKRFSKFQPTREWVNEVNLLSWLAREKQNIFTSQPCLHTLTQTILSANQSARTILVVL